MVGTPDCISLQKHMECSAKTSTTQWKTSFSAQLAEMSWHASAAVRQTSGCLSEDSHVCTSLSAFLRCNNLTCCMEKKIEADHWSFCMVFVINSLQISQLFHLQNWIKMSGCETLIFISTHHPLVWHKFSNACCCERALSRHNMVSNSHQLKLTLVDMLTKIAINFGLRGSGDKWPRPLRFMRVATSLDLFFMHHVIKISKLHPFISLCPVKTRPTELMNDCAFTNVPNMESVAVQMQF